MKFQIRLFNFFGTPVVLKLWFLLILFWLEPSFVLAIFLSVLLHELSHGIVAHKLGYKVKSISIDLFSGSAEIDANNLSEKDSIKITLAGPLSNLLLSLLLFFTEIENEFIHNLININLILFTFNILPIFPLDGGKILRDSIFLTSKNRRKSVIYSSLVSLIFSLPLLIWSISSGYYILVLLLLFFIYFAYIDLKKII